MNSKNNLHRFFSDFYDSVFQRPYRQLVNSDPLTRFRYIGKLRLDSILSQSLILSDTQLLDGAFFLDPRLTPQVLLDALDRGSVIGSAIEIRSRNTSLQTSLLMFVKDMATNTMKEFSFSGIFDPHERMKASKFLLHKDPDTISEWTDILTAFCDAGVNPENIETLQAAWSYWFELQQKGKLTVLQWNTKRGFPIKEYLGTKTQFLEGISTKNAGAIANFIYDNVNKRSLIDFHLGKVKMESNLEDLRQLAVLEARYHKAYDAAIAWQHECGSFESDLTTLTELLNSSAPDQFSSSYIIDSNMIINKVLNLDNLDPHFLYRLGSMPSSKYQEFIWKNSAHLSNWWYHDKLDELRVAVGELVQQIEEVQLPTHIPENGDGLVSDIIRVILDTITEFAQLIKPFYTFFKGANDIRIKYFSSRRSTRREALIQRIIDVAREHQADE